MYHQASGVPAGFLSTLPARGATGARYQMLPIVEFLSTLPARGATAIIQELNKRDNISIHAPREGSDSPHPLRWWGRCNFYPRSPRGERRCGCVFVPSAQKAFLSTLPARGATYIM